MSYEERVLALFEEANPAPDDQVLENVEIEPATYLATLETRSSDMTRLDDRLEETQTNRRPGSWAWRPPP